MIVIRLKFLYCINIALALKYLPIDHEIRKTFHLSRLKALDMSICGVKQDYA